MVSGWLLFIVRDLPLDESLSSFLIYEEPIFYVKPSPTPISKYANQI